MADKIKAFLVHLTCSAAVAALLAYLVFGIWYPGPLDKAIGVQHIFLIILVVDSSIGPLLTLILYRKGKKGLAMDLGIIVVLQIAAMAYGVHTVAEGRPVWIVYNSDRFDAVLPFEVSAKYRAKAPPKYRAFSWLGPHWVASIAPKDKAARDKLLFESLSGGPDLPQRPDLYQPLGNALVSMQEHAKPLDELYRANPADKVDKILAQWPQATAWLPLSARMVSMVVLLDAQHKVAAVVDLRPWD